MRIILSSIIAILLSITTFSSQSTEHSSSIGLIYGTGNTTSDLTDEDPHSSEQSGIFYDFSLSESDSILAMLSKGNDDFCVIVCFNYERREAKWDSLQINYKKSFQMTRRWSPFIRAGLNYYKSEISGNYSYENNPLVDVSKSGFNYVAAVGLQFQANNGFRFGFEAQHMPMDIIDANSYSVLVGFTF